MIEEVFESLLFELDQSDDDDWDERIEESLNTLRAAYESLRVDGRPEIDYRDPATQAAYVFAYGIGRAEFTYQLLKKHRAALGEPIFGKPSVNVTSLGGGPGSEIAGLVKYLLDPSNGENVKAIKYRVIDKDAEWASVCEKLVGHLNRFIEIDTEFIKLNLASRDECKDLSLKGDDLIILSFIISEVSTLENKDEIADNLRRIFKTTDKSSRIFYNDNNASTFYYFFNGTRKFVKGMGRVAEINEFQGFIACQFEFGATYLDYIDNFGVTPHSTSDALSKFLVRADV